ncbi:hypothetical protein [Actinopolymorpha pittospori]
MTIAQQRSVLERVARGELSPEEAERELAALDPSQQANPSNPPSPAAGMVDPVPAPPVPVPPTPPGPPTAPATPAPWPTAAIPTYEPADEDPTGSAAHAVLRVHVSLNAAGTIEIAGEEDADEVRLEGPHRGTVDRDGDNVHVEGQVGDDTLLVVPANAHLHLELNGGDALVRGVGGPLHAHLNVGDVRLEAKLTEGESRIDANAGNVTVVLSPDSDVRVTARCPAEYDIDQRLKKVGRGEWALGDGTARLEIDGNLAELAVRVG